MFPPTGQKGPLFPHPHQHLFIDLLTILTGVKWYLIVVLIHIPQVISDVEHVFICVLDICMFSVDKSIQVLCPFLMGVFLCVCFILEVLYKFLDIKPLSALTGVAQWIGPVNQWSPV